MNNFRFDPKTLLLSAEKGSKVFFLNDDQELTTHEDKINRYRMEITLNCNLKCSYCIVFKNEIKQKVKNMTLETAKHIVDKFNEEVGKDGSIIIIGGEPLINWEVGEYIIENALGRKTIFTNGLNLKDKIKYLKEKDVTTIISLDGSTPEHNSERFSPLAEDRMTIVVKNIKKMAANNNRLGLATVIHGGNIDSFLEIAKFYKDLGVRNISFAYPHYTKNGPSAADFDMNKYTKGICSLLDFSKNEGVYIEQIGPAINSILKRNVNKVSCKILGQQRTFYPSGEETRCMKLDTLDNYKLDDFYQYLPVNNTRCDNCAAINICGGGCPWDGAMANENRSIDPRACEHNKALVNFILKDIEKEVLNLNREEAIELIKSRYLRIANPIMY